jgi:HD-GYP domain-containing protein (c-di-GMP phosphodiesterase class II)
MKHILVVEANPGVRNLYKAALEPEGYVVSAYSLAKDALMSVSNNTYDLAIVDSRLPDMDGFSFIEEMRKKTDHPPVVIATGLATIESAVTAVKKGADDFITKPFTVQTLLVAIERNMRLAQLSRRISELEMIRSILSLNRVITSLTEIGEFSSTVLDQIYSLLHPDEALLYFFDEDTGLFFLRKARGAVGDTPPAVFPREIAEKIVGNVRESVFLEGNGTLDVALQGKMNPVVGILRLGSHEREFSEKERNFLSIFGTQVGIALENVRLLERIKDSYISAIRSLVNSLEAKDRYTKGHSEQVAYYAVAIGKVLGLDQQNLESLRNAAYLHDLGKLGIRDSIILKDGSLTVEEFDLIKKHPLITMDILRPLKMKREELEACLYHHERPSGKGYPEGLKGDEIPMMAKILAVADSLSAMISERPYRKKMEINEAIRELKRNVGEQFDRKVVDALLVVLQDSTDVHTL